MRFAFYIAFSLLIIVLGTVRCEAQYANTETRHDWSFQVSDYRFGLIETEVVPFGMHTTTFYCGGEVFQTSWRAWPIAGTTFGVIIAAIFAIKTLRSRETDQSSTPSQP